MPVETLLVFARAPVPGQVKRRLIPALGRRQATRVYRQLLGITLDAAQAATVSIRQLWCTPDCEHEFFAAMDDSDWIQLRQHGDDLGQRMLFALRYALANPAGKPASAVLIGSDCPSMTASYLRQAFDSLAMDGNDAVLGPATDGGYVLIGLRHADASLFEGIDWGSATVLADTRRRLQDLGWRWCELEPLPDIDRPEDVSLLPIGGAGTRPLPEQGGF